MLIAIGICFILLVLIVALSALISAKKRSAREFALIRGELASYSEEFEALKAKGYISLATAEALKNRYEYAFTGAVRLEHAPLPAPQKILVKDFLSSYRKIGETVKIHNEKISRN